MASTLRYSTGPDTAARLAVARIAAAPRVQAERAALRARQAAHEETCDCLREYEACSDYPR